MTAKINGSEQNLLKPRISVFGIGGAGGNALNNMIKSNLEGVEFVAANTDAQALSTSLASNRIQLGVNLTKGLGAGSFPTQGKAAAEENIEDIIKFLDGNNMIFIAAGMGGGTGTGAAPVIARLAKERDILTVGVVTKPFHFEGKYRMETAEAGIEELRNIVDTLIVIPNQNLFRIANEQTTFESAFKMADDVLHAGVRSVTDLITMPGLINLDFADIKTIMTKMGKAMMGTGESTGENRAVNACHEAISNPLLDDISISGAKGVLVNMTGGPDMTLFEADLAVNTIKKEVDPTANIIFGSAFNENMKGKIRISVVATGIDFDASSRIQENISQPTTFAASEIRSDNKSSEKQVIEVVAGQGQRVFFDPGISKEPQPEIEETKAADFQTGRVLQEYTETVVAKEPIKVKVKEPTFEEELATTKKEAYFLEPEENHENYPVNFADSLFDEEDNFKKVAKRISKTDKKFELPESGSVKKEDEKKEEVKKEVPKKEGFGLFGFMNRKSSVENQPPKLVDKIESKYTPPARHKKLERHVDIKISDDEDDLENIKMVSDKKLAQKAIKVTKAPNAEDFSVEDDILNVPAFFRRKK
jgi:cell division protein FtsZ